MRRAFVFLTRALRLLYFVYLDGLRTLVYYDRLTTPTQLLVNNTDEIA